MRDSPTPTAETGSEAERQLAEENAELRIRLQELQDTLDSIHSGDVDALIVNDDIYTLESAHAATNRLRQDVLDQMEDAVFAFDNDGNIIYLNSAAERRYRVSSANVLGCHRSEVYAESEQSDVSPSGFGAFGRPESLHAVPHAPRYFNEYPAACGRTHIRPMRLCRNRRRDGGIDIRRTAIGNFTLLQSGTRIELVEIFVRGRRDRLPGDEVQNSFHFQAQAGFHKSHADEHRSPGMFVRSPLSRRVQAFPTG